MSKRIPITVANGDGIGPEIMAATLRILEASEAPLEIETIDIGEKVYLAGNHPSGRRLQELERYCEKGAWSVRQCTAMRFLSPVHRDETSGDGRRRRARERGRSLRGYRASPDESGRSVFETDLTSRVRKDHPLRV